MHVRYQIHDTYEKTMQFGPQFPDEANDAQAHVIGSNPAENPYAKITTPPFTSQIMPKNKH